MRVRCRDNIAEMFIRRMAACQGAAKEDLLEAQKRQRKLSEELIAKLEEVLELLSQQLDDAETGRRVRELLTPYGSLEQLQADCAAIRAWGGDNYYQLIWDTFKSWRAALFRMARALRFSSTTEDPHLMDALKVVLAHEHRKAEWIDVEVELSFASERWRKLVIRSSGHPVFRAWPSDQPSTPGGLRFRAPEQGSQERRRVYRWIRNLCRRPQAVAALGRMPEATGCFL